jgi:hypothetical protein
MIEELESVHWPDGKVLLTGDPWSGSPVNDDGYPSEFFWYFNVKTRTRVFDNSSFGRATRALCVRGPAPVTKRLGFWVDPSTGLMWAGRDSLGNSILYSEATKYCGDLRLARYSDWRVATIEEMQGISDKSVEAAGESRRTDEHGPEPVFFHVKGNIFLTGMEWANTSPNEGTGPHEEVWVFDFIDGRAFHEKAYSVIEKRALCVRGPGH